MTTVIHVINGVRTEVEVEPGSDAPPVSAYVSAVQLTLDTAAAAKGYDNIFTAVSYVDDPNPLFDADGRAFKAWRSAVWTACIAILADVDAATRPAPTISELLAELPPAP